MKPTNGWGKEVCEAYEVNYAWVKYGDKTTCGWCHKDITKIKDPSDHIEAHNHTQKEYQKKLSQAILSAEDNLLREIMEEIPKKKPIEMEFGVADRYFLRTKTVKDNDIGLAYEDGFNNFHDQVNTLLESKLSTVKK